jgi:hypothetical protein
VLSFLAVIVCVYLAAVASLFLAQRSFLFVPGGELRSPPSLGLAGVETVTQS